MKKQILVMALLVAISTTTLAFASPETPAIPTNVRAWQDMNTDMLHIAWDHTNPSIPYYLVHVSYWQGGTLLYQNIVATDKTASMSTSNLWLYDDVTITVRAINDNNYSSVPSEPITIKICGTPQNYKGALC